MKRLKKAERNPSTAQGDILRKPSESWAVGKITRPAISILMLVCKDYEGNEYTSVLADMQQTLTKKERGYN